MAGDRQPLSVVVPSRDRPERLRDALAALRESLGDGDELIVVDSASSDAGGTAQVAEGAGARLIRAGPGASAARNLGWRAARHDDIGFVDDDVRVDPAWATAMVTALAEHPDAAFITGRTDVGDAIGTMTVAVKDDMLPAVIDRTSRGVLGHSANLVVRRSALVAVGGFDESLGAGARWRAAEDTDLFDRIIGGGRCGRYEPAAAAVHVQWRRIREWVLLQYGYGVGSGSRLAKLWRLDRRRWRLVVIDDVWTWGIGQLPGELARRDGYRAIGTLLRLAGMARGAIAASVTPLERGHFRSRRGRSNSS
jgi:glycosyltransferase involved in cell wall biosynthesis